MNRTFVRFLTLLVCTASLLSCVKRPADFNPEPEVPLDFATLFTSVTEAFGTQTMSDIKTGEFVNKMTTVQVADFQPQIVEQKAQQILCYNMPKDEYKVIQTLESYFQDGKSEKATTEYNYSINKESIVTSWTRSLLLIYLCDPSQPMNQQVNAVCSELEIQDFKGPPPIEVKNSTNCGGLNPCELDYRRISYYRSADFADKTGTKMRNKELITALIAKNAPFLSRVIEFCQHGIFDIDPKTSIYAKLCEKTRYFTTGDSNQVLCTP